MKTLLRKVWAKEWQEDIIFALWGLALVFWLIGMLSLIVGNSWLAGGFLISAATVLIVIIVLLVLDLVLDSVERCRKSREPV